MAEEFTQPTDSGGDLDLSSEESARLALEEAETLRKAMVAWRLQRDRAGVVVAAPPKSPGPAEPRATAEEALALPGDGKRGPNPWN